MWVDLDIEEWWHLRIMPSVYPKVIVKKFLLRWHLQLQWEDYKWWNLFAMWTFYSCIWRFKKLRISNLLPARGPLRRWNMQAMPTVHEETGKWEMWTRCLQWPLEIEKEWTVWNMCWLYQTIWRPKSMYCSLMWVRLDLNTRGVMLKLSALY